MLLANTRSDYGWVMVAIGQSEKTEIITWSYVTFSDILVECIAQLITLYGIILFAIKGYQSFSYEKNALNMLYFER